MQFWSHFALFPFFSQWMVAVRGSSTWTGCALNTQTQARWCAVKTLILKKIFWKNWLQTPWVLRWVNAWVFLSFTVWAILQYVTVRAIFTFSLDRPKKCLAQVWSFDLFLRMYTVRSIQILVFGCGLVFFLQKHTSKRPSGEPMPKFLHVWSPEGHILLQSQKFFSSDWAETSFFLHVLDP